MGKGIALQAKKKYPELYHKYKDICDNKKMQPGKPRLLTISSSNKRFLLFPTKDHWKYPSKYEWIEEGLKRIRENQNKIKNGLALPPLGCGNGQLDWIRVRKMIVNNLKDCDFDLYIYEP